MSNGQVPAVKAEPDSLFLLLEDLEVHGRPSPGWTAKYAPGGNLDEAWAGGKAFSVARLASAAGEHGALLRCAVAVGRRVARHLPEADARALRALEAAEGFVAAQVTRTELLARHEGGYIAEVDAHVHGFVAVAAVTTIFAVAGFALGADSLSNAEERAQFRHVALWARNALRNGEGMDDGDPELADLIRAYVPAPSLRALEEAFGDRG